MTSGVNKLEQIPAILPGVSGAATEPLEALSAVSNSRVQEIIDMTASIGTRFAEIDSQVRQPIAALLETASKLAPEPLDIRAVRSPEVSWLEAVVDATNANTTVTRAQTRVLQAQERRLHGLHDALQAILREQRTTTRLAWGTLLLAFVAAVLALVGIFVGA